MSRRKLNRAARKQNIAPWAVLLAVGGVLLIGLAVFALARGGSASKVPLEVSGSPKLKVDRQQVDLGEVKLGQTVEVSFQLANVGDRQLRFTEAPYVEIVEGC